MIKLIFRTTLVSFLLYSLFIFYKQTLDLQTFDEYNNIYELTPATGKLNPIIRFGDGRFYFFCSGVVISKDYALTAAHCLTDWTGEAKQRNLTVSDVSGNLRLTNAKIAAVDNLRDLALIRGDFREFESAPVDWYGNCQWTLPVTELTLCGFPSGESLYCTKAVYTNNFFFRLRVRGGPIFQGQSGGPVIAVCEGKPTVIGVNSAVDYSGIIVGPVIGSRSRLWN